MQDRPIFDLKNVARSMTAENVYVSSVCDGQSLTTSGTQVQWTTTDGTSTYYNAKNCLNLPTYTTE